MRNIKSKARVELIKLNGETQKVILNIIKDGLIYLLNRMNKVENHNVIKHLTLLYFNISGENEKEIIEFENLSVREQGIFYHIMIEGITDVIIVNQYLTMIYLTREDKDKIIEEIIKFISNITGFSEFKVNRKIKLNIKKERKNARL